MPLDSQVVNRSAQLFVRSCERRLLALLAGGLPDEAIGRALAISHRTLRRRLHALQERLHAPTRFQLALHATRRGWL